ncbi:MAG TPA: DUF2334 domain-containing protein [Methylomirabilota bacterium]|nr:DUF2334 domain-containing protein [Methylomirabilota bacterium]
MKYVIIRDDDTNALTPVEYLERLYRPFLDRRLPVNLATIPNVRTDVCYPGNGEPEGFLVAKKGTPPLTVPIGENTELVDYLKSNPFYEIVQHAYHHEFVDGNPEFDQLNRVDVVRRLDQGAHYLKQAGLGKPRVFVAPYDKMTRVSIEEIARRFSLVSTGWFEPRRMPRSWWPRYAVKKLTGKPHWRMNGTILMSHPGCHLSYHRPYPTMLQEIEKSIASRRTTVLVAHWWEFFRGNKPDEPFIKVLHDLAELLASRKDIKVIRFRDVFEQNLPLN